MTKATRPPGSRPDPGDRDGIRETAKPGRAAPPAPGLNTPPVAPVPLHAPRRGYLSWPERRQVPAKRLGREPLLTGKAWPRRIRPAPCAGNDPVPPRGSRGGLPRVRRFDAKAGVHPLRSSGSSPGNNRPAGPTWSVSDPGLCAADEPSSRMRRCSPQPHPRLVYHLCIAECISLRYPKEVFFCFNKHINHIHFTRSRAQRQ